MNIKKWTALALAGSLSACMPVAGGVQPIGPGTGAIQTEDDIPAGFDSDDPNYRIADDPSQLADGTLRGDDS